MVSENMAQAASELPVELVDRLSDELSHALDAWTKHTNIAFIAHVHPASSGKGVWLENARASQQRAERQARSQAEMKRLISVYHDAQAAWRALDEEDDTKSTPSPEWDSYEAAEDAILYLPCRSLEDVRKKVEFVLSDENAFDSVKNCFRLGEGDEGTCLARFLRSLLGEAAE